MFSDYTNEADCVNINPSWKENRELTEDGMQTEEMPTDSQETQTSNQNEISTQTEETVLNIDDQIDYNIFNLLVFLQKVEPKITQQLKQNVKSKAFNFYTPLGVGENLETEKIEEFKHDSWNNEREISSLSWNCTGSILAVAYGKHLHDSWCQHDAGIAIWNVSRMKGKVPQNTIETDCCVTSLEFHPKIPSILAVGKFTGIVSIFNVSGDEDPNLASSESFGQDSHKEPITGLNWIKHPDSLSKLMLVSSSLDGKILFWKLSDDLNKMEITDGFIILAKYLPRNSVAKEPEAEVGVTCISFNPDDPSIFIIGTEGGVISQCSLNSRAETNRTLSIGLRLKSPIGMSFSQHNGVIETVDFSPHTRNVFCSCSSDGEIRIYSLLQLEPVVLLRTSSGLKSISWSPVCPLLIGGVTSNGQFLLYDLLVNSQSPSIVECQLGDDGATLSFNKKNYQLVAMALRNGKVQIWRLGSGFQSTRTNEVAKLVALGSVKSEY